MSTTTLNPRSLTSFLYRTWQGLSAPAKVLTAVGLLMFASAAFHAVVFLLSGTAWEGPVSWRKPITFGLSLGLTAITIALVEARLRLWRWVSWALLGTIAVVTLVEDFLITMQVWRGVPSHFNIGTPFDAAVFSLMGQTVAVFALVLTVLAILTFTSAKPGASALTLTIRAGMVLLIAGQVLGAAIIAAGTPAMVSGDEAALFGPHGVMAGAAGVLKSPHAVALHAVQVLPLLGWLVQQVPWSEVRRRRAAWSATAGYSLVLAVSIFQAYTGQAQFMLGIPALLAALAGTVLIAVPYVQVGRRLIRRQPAALDRPSTPAF
ncbi:hypothetical protein D477_009505 [Arthrobacter crystallopoietes BAB-32]|uniref:Uncharacterized protein n=1 Tax=Arthrobacter crystallopoietes BAB-32 TaxID=1246476 RepID=N1V867_9MICC|nr:hypothetical protein [Arthrobacter crystallopoietes]EMY34448.1 hypothetical protein D477_009505 [Arthrobacter crystallopoietes BAB-32]